MKSEDSWGTATISEDDFLEHFIRIEDEARAKMLFEESKLKKGHAILNHI